MLHSLDSQDFFFEAVVTVNMSALLVLATMFIGSKIKKLGNLTTFCLHSQSDPADHVLCEDDWDLVDLQPLHPLHGGAPSYLHGFPQVKILLCGWMKDLFIYRLQLSQELWGKRGFPWIWWWLFADRVDEGAKNKQQGEGDIKEKLVISTMNKDLVSRNEKVQVQVKPFEPLVQL